MKKKSVSATILILFMSLFFAVVGSSFYYFEYWSKRTLVESVGIVADEGVQVFQDEKLSVKIDKLKLSDMEIGLKPATGELDSETQIPSTINDQGTSEGYYASVFVKSAGNFRVQLSNINIETSHDELMVKEERKNIFIAVKDLKNSVKTLENDGVEICRYSDVAKPVEITFLIWLGSFASDELEGAEINFDLKFVAI